MDLRMPISRVRSMTAVYMDWKMTMKPMMTAMPMTVRRPMLKPGIFSGVRVEISSSMVWTSYCFMPGVVRISLRTASWNFGGFSVRM